MGTLQSSATWLHLGAVPATTAAARDSCHHRLRAARVARYVLLLLPSGSDQERHHDGDQHSEEQPHHDADDQHQPVVAPAAVLLPVDLPRHDALGGHFPLWARLPLAAALVQRNVQDVGAAIVAYSDLTDIVWDVRGPAFGAPTASRERIRLPADGVVFQASLPDAAVSAAARADGVDGVDVPLSSCGDLEQDSWFRYESGTLEIF